MVASVASSKEMATKADLTTATAELKAEIKAIKWMFGLVFIMNFAMFIKLFF